MKISFNEKLVAYLTLVSGLTISGVAIYYSVLGLTAIFAAAVIPIMIMGVALEVGKIVASLWLKQNWKIAPFLIKTYLIVAIGILMSITSIGIFGLLSKAHNDQGLETGNNYIQIQNIDRQIEIEKRNINDATKVISQLDQAVQALIDADRIRGPNGSIAVRKNQAQERDSLNKIIADANQRINTLEQQKLPLLQQRLDIEAKVGPIKYIAKFVYGDSTDAGILEKSVTWVIIIIVLVFDPLAIVLLLASQFSFQKFRNQPPIVNAAVLKEEEVVKIEPVLEDVKLDDIKSDNDFDLSNHPYLFKTPTTRHPPGVEPVGPQVFNNISVTDNVDNKITPKDNNVSSVTTFSEFKDIDWESLPENTEYIKIKNELMSIKTAKEKYWQLNKNERKNNSHNPT
jgi:hypothetical protein